MGGQPDAALDEAIDVMYFAFDQFVAADEADWDAPPVSFDCIGFGSFLVADNVDVRSERERSDGDDCYSRLVANRTGLARCTFIGLSVSGCWS